MLSEDMRSSHLEDIWKDFNNDKVVVAIKELCQLKTRRPRKFLMQVEFEQKHSQVPLQDTYRHFELS